MKKTVGEDFEVEVRVQLPVADLELTGAVYTFVNPDEVGHLLKAAAGDAHLLGLRDRLMRNVHDLTDQKACRYREAAAAAYERSGETEVDSNGIVSVSEDGGAYVQGWFWVSDEEAGVEKGDDEE